LQSLRRRKEEAKLKNEFGDLKDDERLKSRTFLNNDFVFLLSCVPD
jgi:hypothetical protein